MRRIFPLGLLLSVIMIIGISPFSSVVLSAEVVDKKFHESGAIKALQEYFKAQQTFHSTEKRYAQDYSTLYATEGNQLGLISEEFAKARITPETPYSKDLPNVAGYVFFEDTNIQDWASDFGLFAIPGHDVKEIPDIRMFWIGIKGGLYGMTFRDIEKMRIKSMADIFSPHSLWRMIPNDDQFSK